MFHIPIPIISKVSVDIAECSSIIQHNDEAREINSNGINRNERSSITSQNAETSKTNSKALVTFNNTNPTTLSNDLFIKEKNNHNVNKKMLILQNKRTILLSTKYLVQIT